MNRGTQKLSYNVKANEWQHKKFDPKSNFTAAPQAVVVDEQGLKYRKLQTCKCVMVGGVKTPIVPGNTTADYSALIAYKDDTLQGKRYMVTFITSHHKHRVSLQHNVTFSTDTIEGTNW